MLISREYEGYIEVEEGDRTYLLGFLDGEFSCSSHLSKAWGDHSLLLRIPRPVMAAWFGEEAVQHFEERARADYQARKQRTNS